jgi:hypothetical protein
VAASRIDTRYVHVSGVKKEFLASLPEWQGLE